MKVAKHHCCPFAPAEAQVEEALQSREALGSPSLGSFESPSHCILLPITSWLGVIRCSRSHQAGGILELWSCPSFGTRSTSTGPAQAGQCVMARVGSRGGTRDSFLQFMSRGLELSSRNSEKQKQNKRTERASCLQQYNQPASRGILSRRMVQLKP